MRKILICNSGLASGGAERVISILSNNLINDGYEVAIALWMNTPIFYDIDNRVKIINVKQESKSDNIINNIFYFRKIVKQLRPDITISFLALFNILTLFSLIGIKTKKIVCERNDPNFVPFRRFLRWTRNFAYLFADGILTQTENNKKYFGNHIQKKTEVIYNPVLMKSEFVGSALNAKGEKKIISIARLVPQKNQKMLIKAFSRFARDNKEYNLYIYGEGPLRKELENEIRLLNLEQRVYLPGVKKDIFNILKTASVFVLPSNFEGMPNTLIEAMCLGLPCISTKVSGATDLIKNGENGILVDINDEEQLYHALMELINDKEKCNLFGTNACKIYELLNVDNIYIQWKGYIDRQIQNNVLEHTKL